MLMSAPFVTPGSLQKGSVATKKTNKSPKCAIKCRIPEDCEGISFISVVKLEAATCTRVHFYRLTETTPP